MSSLVNLHGLETWFVVNAFRRRNNMSLAAQVFTVLSHDLYSAMIEPGLEERFIGHVLSNVVNVWMGLDVGIFALGFSHTCKPSAR